MTNDFADRLSTFRPLLLRVGRQHLRNPAWVEDAVSDTLLAALERPAAFEGRAALQSWLVGILKHKLVDQVRRHAREQARDTVDEDADEGVDPFPQHDRAWCDPQAALQQRQFMRQFDACLRSLPSRHGRAFVLSDWMGFSTQEVCKKLDVSPTNLSVMRHRARRQLQESLQARGLATPVTSP